MGSFNHVNKRILKEDMIRHHLSSFANLFLIKLYLLSVLFNSRKDFWDHAIWCNLLVFKIFLIKLNTLTLRDIMLLLFIFDLVTVFLKNVNIFRKGLNFYHEPVKSSLTLFV